ncbi:MAG: Flp family type IVb pilin [Pseudomonadota bacterium]|nr:Flp family type IVb pilin [Pseudomonadota bacterium]
MVNQESQMSIREKLVRFVRDEEGLTTVEYAVAGGLIAAAVIAAFVLLGGKVNEKIGDITTGLD